MNPWRIIIKRSRTSLGILACAIALSLAMYFGSSYFGDSLHQELLQSRSQINAQQSLLASKQQDLDYLTAHIAQFHALRKMGLLSTPDREGWVEQLLVSQKQLGIPETLVYALPPPVPMTNGNADAAAGATAAVDATAEVPTDTPLVHDLEINLRDIHEDELLGLLTEFQSKIRDRFRVQACQLSLPTPTGLSARCTLRFFTLPQNAGVASTATNGTSRATP